VPKNLIETPPHIILLYKALKLKSICELANEDFTKRFSLTVEGEESTFKGLEEIVAWPYRFQSYRYPRASAQQAEAPAEQENITFTLDDNKERVIKVKAVEGWESFLNPADLSFIQSISGWLEDGRNLTSAQSSWLQRIEKKCAPRDTSWYDLADEGLQKKREYAIMHYREAGYYPAEVLRMQADAAYMPDKSVWDKMWGNKYINAGFKRWTDGSRFSVGEVVINKYYPVYYGTTGLIHNVQWSSGNWHYTMMPLDGKEGYDKIISVEEKNLLPASKRNLTALDKAAARKKEEPTF
jgi:hypothetical protein